MHLSHYIVYLLLKSKQIRSLCRFLFHHIRNTLSHYNIISNLRWSFYKNLVISFHMFFFFFEWDITSLLKNLRERWIYYFKSLWMQILLNLLLPNLYTVLLLFMRYNMPNLASLFIFIIFTHFSWDFYLLIFSLFFFTKNSI